MTQRARILYLVVSGDRVGGAEIQYEYLVRGLDRTRFAPLVVAPAHGALTADLAAAGVECVVLPFPAWRRRTWLTRRAAAAALTALARRTDAQLVHGDFSLGPYVTGIAEALGVPSVLHVRRAVQRAWMRRYALQRATRLIAIGERYREQLQGYGCSPERIALIADATDLRRFRPARRNALREAHPEWSDRVLFGLVGRIEPFKRQLEFLQAARRLLACGRRVQFVVAGAPNDDWPRYVRRVLAFPAAHGLGPQVWFAGWRHDIEGVIGALDALVTLSGGSVLLEAMACGVPVVSASDRHAARLEMVRDGESGLVVPSGDRDALVRAMLRLCDSATLRRALGGNGRRRALAYFGQQRLVRQTEHLYASLLGCGLRNDRAGAPHAAVGQ